MNLKECTDKGMLKKIKPAFELSKKELKESEYDLDSAIRAFDSKDYKWTIIKCYYSMFHAAKSILYRTGYVAKRHIAVLAVLEELNKEGKINYEHVVNFKASMTAREDADYSFSYSREIAEYELDSAKYFFEECKKIKS